MWGSSYKQIETPEIDFHIMTDYEYQRLLDECSDMALSMYFQREPIMKCPVEYNLDLPTLRKSFSSKANNSFVKFKKKLIVEKDYDVRAAIKSLFHSIRILDFGAKIANPDYDDSTCEINTYNQDLMGENIEWIEDVFRETNNNWEEIHKVFKPVYNTYATEFKKVAPKC
jgi:HD superfamily phosphohydrolase